MDAGPARTRAIGRNAIRDELARGAFPQFTDRGFDGVTFDELAVGAGVSRSTFLRYFVSKEDVVLFVFDAVGDDIVSTLSALPATEEEWDVLRRSLDPVVSFLSNTEGKLALMQLIWKTPALYSRLHEKQASWRPRMVEQLAAREGVRAVSPLALRTRVAAALECLTVAIEAWLEDEGRSELHDLIAETFEALRPAR